MLFVVFCMVVFGLLKTCQIFNFIFWAFPFWESVAREEDDPTGQGRLVADPIRDPVLKRVLRKWLAK
ncbi:MAG: hypothetical protein JWQ49_1520 [Edaphobacter sp.]|nr:hypothetical protein [Edaphobacter sp.]